MSNYEELKAREESGSVEFVASGNLNDNTPVVLKSDGTVEVSVASYVSDTTGGTVTINSVISQNFSAAFDESAGKVLITYSDSTSNYYNIAQVGTVSGTTISFGSQYIFTSDAAYYSMIGYDPVFEKNVILFKLYPTGTDDSLRGCIATINGTAISFTSIQVYDSSAIWEYWQAICYCPIHETFFVQIDSTYTNIEAEKGMGVYINSAGTITFGGKTTIEAGGEWNGIEVCYIGSGGGSNDRVLLTYIDLANSPDFYGRARIVTMTSKTSVQYSSYYEYWSDRAHDIVCAYDPINDKAVIAFEDYNNSYNRGRYKVATMTGEGSSASISYVGSGVFNPGSGAYELTSVIDLVYDPNARRFAFAWRERYYYANVRSAVISGNSLSFGDEIVNAFPEPSYSGEDLEGCFDTLNNKIVFVFQADDGGRYGKADVMNIVMSSNNDQYIGFTNEPINDTESGLVKTTGAIQDVSTSLTIGSDYYIDVHGELTTTSVDNVKVGKAVSANNLLLS